MPLRAAVISLLIAGAAASPAGAATFSPPVKLGGASGGEPSIISAPLGDVFVSGPQGIPAGANMSTGVGFWASHDGGTTFGPAELIGSQAGGGDSDVIAAKGAVYVADLEAAAAQVCKSVDRGKTFDGIGPAPDPAHCTTINGAQSGPSNDREWLTAAPDGTLYLTYHEFVSAQPVAFRSDNAGGDNFGNPCGSLVTDPAIEANIPTDVTGGTLVSKPVTDAAGNLYVLFSSTTQAENAAAVQQGQPSGTFSQLYLAVSKDKCQTFTDYTVFDGQAKYGANKVQFGDIFNDLVIDGAGNLYTVGAGYVNTSPNTTSLYLLSSTDHGRHWTEPRAIVPPGSAYMMPAAVAGPSAGQLAVGYFRTINGVTDPNAGNGKWTYSAAQTANATAASPVFTFNEPIGGADFHNGEICNLGILCGQVPGGPSDRSLADFTSGASNAAGCPIFSFAGNPTGSAGKNSSSNTFNYVAQQTSDCFALSAGSPGLSGVGSGPGVPSSRPGTSAPGTTTGGSKKKPKGKAKGGKRHVPAKKKAKKQTKKKSKKRAEKKGRARGRRKAKARSNSSRHPTRAHAVKRDPDHDHDHDRPGDR